MVGVDPQILVHGTREEGAVPITGRVKWIGGEACLYVDTESGRMVPIWPQGATPLRVGERRGVALPGGGRLLDGDRFGGAGILQQEDPLFMQAPGRCRRQNGLLVIDPVGIERLGLQGSGSWE
ncbi:hypothetical protein [Nonomuraea sp. NPDC049504]|uniref:hypothetical protein n=1 Tax=Nonomuraea sp. NPDC049504 TaxID=3154729 RepID=UPI0034414A81